MSDLLLYQHALLFIGKLVLYLILSLLLLTRLYDVTGITGIQIFNYLSVRCSRGQSVINQLCCTQSKHVDIKYLFLRKQR